MEIKVLGTGCAKCKTTYQIFEKIINENNLDLKLMKIEDIVEILNSGIMANMLCYVCFPPFSSQV